MKHYGVIRQVSGRREPITFNIEATSGAVAARLANDLKYAAEYQLGRLSRPSKQMPAPAPDVLRVARSYL